MKLKIRAWASVESTYMFADRLWVIPRSSAAKITDETVLARLAGGSDVFVDLAGPPTVRRSFEGPQARRSSRTSPGRLAAFGRRPARARPLLRRHPRFGRGVRETVGQLVAPEDDPLEARSLHVAAEIGVEQLVGAFALVHAMETVILRPFPGYGPGASETSSSGLDLA